MGSSGFHRGGACVNFPQTKRYVDYVNDFLFDSDVDLTQNWTSTGTGTEVITQPSTNDAKDGTVVLTTQASTPATDDNCQLQHKQEFIKLNVANVTTRLVWRFKLSVIATAELFLGFAITDSDIVGGTNYATDIIGFSKVNGSSNLDLIAAINAAARTDYAVAGTGTKVTGLATGSSAFTLVADTWTEIALEIVTTDAVGGAVLRAWINGQPCILSGANFDLAITTLPYDEELTITMAVAAGSAAQRSLTVDCLELVAQRAAAA